MKNNNELFSFVRSGDERAYVKLVDMFRDHVLLYAKSIVGDVEIYFGWYIMPYPPNC